MYPTTPQDSPATTRPDHHNQAGNLLPWLTLAHIPGMHSRLFNRLLETFHDPVSVLAAEPGQLVRAGVNDDTARCIRNAGQGRMGDDVKKAVDNALSWKEQGRQHIITLHDPQYPGLLATIPDPPPVLYVKGDPTLPGKAMIAMVGSRRPTVDGRRNARHFAGEIAAHGLGICSGLALGIDVESHRGTLAENGKTVAVLGTGIDEIYPAGNREMFARVAEQGALVSEFNPGTLPRPENFPRRNRIISGLSLGVLVVEAGLKSGSMITAKLALEQGREVFAIPGSIHNPMARGCHRLIAEGAKLVEQAREILEECAAPYQGASVSTTCKHDHADAPGHSLDVVQQQILALIGRDPVFTDVLVSESALPVTQVSAALAELEMLGLVRREGGGFVISNDWA